GRWRALGLAQLTRMADHVIANAEAVRRLVVDREGISAEKVSVIRNGLDLARFEARMNEPLHAPLPDTGGQPFAVQVANMSHPVKRQEDFLHAMAQVKGFHALFIGDGGRRPMLEKLAAEQGLGGRAHFLGFRKDAPAIQARAAFGVLCSETEGLSNAVIEGMAASLPMIVTDVGGNPELVRDGVSGLVVPPKNPQAL